MIFISMVLDNVIIQLPHGFQFFFLFVVDFVIHWNETAMGLVFNFEVIIYRFNRIKDEDLASYFNS